MYGRQCLLSTLYVIWRAFAIEMVPRTHKIFLKKGNNNEKKQTHNFTAAVVAAIVIVVFIQGERSFAIVFFCFIRVLCITFLIADDFSISNAMAKTITPKPIICATRHFSFDRCCVIYTVFFSCVPLLISSSSSYNCAVAFYFSSW